MLLDDSLARKVARHPVRFGLLIGFLGVPMLWMAGEDVLRFVFGGSLLPAQAFWNYAGSGALVGALLGGGSARIWTLWRGEQKAQARGLALLMGGAGTGFYLAQVALQAATSPFFGRVFVSGVLRLFLSCHLPFLLCFLLLCGALLAPRR